MVSKTRIKKAAELLVANELLRLGCDVFVPLVDTGIDIICLVNHKPMLIQVKESKCFPDGTYWQKINKEELQKYCAENMFYIFVLRARTRVDYLVLPSTFISENLDKLNVDSKGQIHFFFEVKNWRVIDKRKDGLDLSKFLDNFSYFKP
ncbi:MAG: hypothetical protein QXI48_07325 [Candidatus Bathyarchaeia archaeon]